MKSADSGTFAELPRRVEPEVPQTVLPRLRVTHSMILEAASVTFRALASWQIVMNQASCDYDDAMGAAEE